MQSHNSTQPLVIYANNVTRNIYNYNYAPSPTPSAAMSSGPAMNPDQPSTERGFFLIINLKRHLARGVDERQENAFRKICGFWALALDTNPLEFPEIQLVTAMCRLPEFKVNVLDCPFVHSYYFGQTCTGLMI